MRLPKALTIAGHSIKVKYKKRLVHGGSECWGTYNNDKGEITLRYGQSRTQKQEIVLHEAVHAISDIHLLNLTEKAVKILGIELLGLIRNNKLNFRK